jgi:hypothetical protein
VVRLARFGRQWKAKTTAPACGPGILIYSPRPGRHPPEASGGWLGLPRLVTSEKLLPVWALYSAATEEQRLHTETRFLMLAQALETYHRTVSTDTRVSADVNDERRRRVLSKLGPEDVSWVTEALAWSNQLTLRIRLEALYREVPRPLIDHLPNRDQLPDQIKNTRNFLTHFSSGKNRLQGFRLIETTDSMRVVLQYFLLQAIGFSRDKALDIAHATFVRDLTKPRATRGMLLTND